MTMNDPKNIPTFDVTPGGKHGCYLVFTCPTCKKKNYHGGTYGKKGDGDGHRVSHCNCWPDGYYLREV